MFHSCISYGGADLLLVRLTAADMASPGTRFRTTQVGLFGSRAYQMSVTLPAIAPNTPWLFLIIIVSALFTSISTLLAEEIHMMCVPGVLLDPPVMFVVVPAYDSKPSQYMPPPGLCNKLT